MRVLATDPRSQTVIGITAPLPGAGMARTKAGGEPERCVDLLAARYAFCRRVFEVERLAGMDEGVDCVRRQRRLGEARQDQFELSRIGGDVADREDPGQRRGAARRIDPDPVLVER